MKINIEELEESKKVKLVSDVVSGRISHQDVLSGHVEFCDRCDKWENKFSLTECALMRAWERIKNDIKPYDEHVSSHSYDALKYSIEGIESDLEKATND